VDVLSSSAGLGAAASTPLCRIVIDITFVEKVCIRNYNKHHERDKGVKNLPNDVDANIPSCSQEKMLLCKSEESRVDAFKLPDPREFATSYGSTRMLANAIQRPRVTIALGNLAWFLSLGWENLMIKSPTHANRMNIITTRTMMSMTFAAPSIFAARKGTRKQNSHPGFEKAHVTCLDWFCDGKTVVPVVWVCLL